MSAVKDFNIERMQAPQLIIFTVPTCFSEEFFEELYHQEEADGRCELPRPIIKDEASRDPLEPFRLKPLAEEPAPTGLSSGELFKRESLPFPAHDHSGRIGVFQSPLV